MWSASFTAMSPAKGKGSRKKATDPKKKQGIQRHVERAKKRAAQPKVQRKAARIRWRMFAMAYLANGLNATKAYQEVYPQRAAKLGSKAITVAAYQLLNYNPEVLDLVVRGVEARLQEFGVRADNVLREAGNLALSRMSDIASWGPAGVNMKPSWEIPDHAMAAVQSVESIVDSIDNGDGPTIIRTRLKVKLHPKTGALKLLMQYFELLGRQQDLQAQIAANPAVQNIGEQHNHYIAYFPPKMEDEEWHKRYGPRPAGREVGASVHPSAPPHLLSNGNPAQTNGK